MDRKKSNIGGYIKLCFIGVIIVIIAIAILSTFFGTGLGANDVELHQSIFILPEGYHIQDNMDELETSTKHVRYINNEQNLNEIVVSEHEPYNNKDYESMEITHNKTQTIGRITVRVIHTSNDGIDYMFAKNGVNYIISTECNNESVVEEIITSLKKK